MVGSVPTEKFVYDFAEGNKDLKDLLGGKGANLAEMTNLGLPVPAGFTITTHACQRYLATGTRPEGLDDEIASTSPRWSRPWAAGLGTRPIRCWCPCAPAPSSPCRA
jgi:pyruvate,orthophosphate dikinase